MEAAVGGVRVGAVATGFSGSGDVVGVTLSPSRLPPAGAFRTLSACFHTPPERSRRGPESQVHIRGERVHLRPA